MPQNSAPAPLDWAAESLWLALQVLLPGTSVEVLPRVASTSTMLLERARNGRDLQPCLLVAEEQTQGRGRLGRQWSSQRGASLTFSLAMPLAPADWGGLSLSVGLALADALDPPQDQATPRIGLKWPNDLWLLDGDAAAGTGRKLGGILIETVAAGAQRVVVAGIGLNLQRWAMTNEDTLSQGRGTLDELWPDCRAPQVLARVAAPLVQALQVFERQGFAAASEGYARRDVLRGHLVHTTQAGLPEGVAQGVDADGALRVLARHGVGVQRVVSGEVSVRRHVPVADAPAARVN